MSRLPALDPVNEWAMSRAGRARVLSDTKSEPERADHGGNGNNDPRPQLSPEIHPTHLTPTDRRHAPARATR